MSTPHEDARPRLLILSFSDIANDGRVLRQVQAFADDFRVTTYGYGEQPHPDIEHIRAIPSTPPWRKHVQALLWKLRRYRAAYWLEGDYRRARKALRGREFDAVIANDLTAAGVVASVAPRSITLLDLHEYWPGLQDDNEAWRKLRLPYFDWLLRNYGSGMRAYTVVSDAIAQRYLREYGFECRVVMNSSVYRDFEAQPVGRPVRIVHSGAAKASRRIEVMMRAVAASSSGATLDLYLTDVGTDYYVGLERLADELGERIRLNPPVPHSELLATLNRFDVGLPFLPPTTTNLELCLPNKFFDYIQARLATVTGPTEAMADLVREYDLGLVTETFSEQELTRVIDELTPESVVRFKQHAEIAARALAGELQIQIWRDELDAIVRAGGRG